MTRLRFLADESCDFAVVRSLRDAGYDVVAVAEYVQRSVDRELIEQASAERRILLTEDKDFGWLVYVSHAESAGVILIRYPGNARSALAQTVLQLVQTQGGEARWCVCRSRTRPDSYHPASCFPLTVPTNDFLATCPPPRQRVQ